MYGTLVKVEEDIPEQPKTPASTSLFVRTVRNFGGPRFRRSVHEGYIEDLLIEEQTEEEEEVSKDFRNVYSGVSIKRTCSLNYFSENIRLVRPY